MKKLLLSLSFSLLFASTSYGQDAKTEAIDSLTTAQTFVKNGSYNKAVEEINYALAKVNELTAAELIKYIPEPPAGFTLINKQSQGIGAAASIAGNAGASAEYSHSSGATVNLTIAMGGVSGNMANLAALGSLFAGLSQDSTAGQSKKVRVQGYTGTELYNSNDQTGSLTFQIGDKTSIMFEGSSIESADLLMQIAKAFDFANFEKSF